MTYSKNKRNLMASVGSAALIIGLASAASAGTSFSSSSYSYSDQDFQGSNASATAILSEVNDQTTEDTVSAMAGSLSEDQLEFYLDLFTGGELSVSGAFDLDENTVSADAVGNDGSLTIDIDTLPAFNDDAASTNVQVVIGDGAENVLELLGEDADVLAMSVGAAIEANGLGLDGEDPSIELTLSQAALSVNDNSVESSAQGSVFEGKILIADGVSAAGDDYADISQLYVDVAIMAEDDVTASDVSADLAMGSHQVSADLGVVSVTGNSIVRADLETVRDSTVSVDDNTLESTTVAMDASQSITTGDGAADVAASMAIGNNQQSMDSVAGAFVGESAILIETNDDMYGSTVSVDGNTVKSSATMSNADNNIAIAANSIGMANEVDIDFNNQQTDGEDLITGSYVAGTLIVSNEQTNGDVVVGSGVEFVQVGLDLGDEDDMETSSLSVSGNTVDAMSTVSTASNTIDLDANTVAGGVGVASNQKTAQFELLSTVDFILVGADIDEDLGADDGGEGSNLDVANNMIRAISVVQSNTNSVSVDTTDLDFAAAEDRADGAQTVDNPTAAIVAANSQVIGYGSAYAKVSDASIGTLIDDDMIDSSSSVDSNAIVAAAYGNDADAGYGASGTANGAVSLDATTIVDEDGEDSVHVAVASNFQVVEDVNLGAEIGSTDAPTIAHRTNDDVMGSSISTSNNAVQAQTIANQATTLTAAVDAVVINTGLQDAFNAVDGNDEVEAAFVAISNQVVDASRLEASLKGDIDDSDVNSALVSTHIDYDLINSSVVSDNNLLSAAAIGNNQGTGVELAATDILTTVGVLNESVVADSEIEVVIGAAGTEGSEGTEATTSSNGSNNVTFVEYSNVGNDYTNDLLQDIVFTMTSPISDAEASFYTTAGLVVDQVANTLTWQAGTTFNKTGMTLIATDGPEWEASGSTYGANGFDGDDAVQIQAAIVTPATPGTQPTHNDGGVIVELIDNPFGGVSASSVSVASNTVTGSAKGNVASNFIDVNATNVDTAINDTYASAYGSTDGEDGLEASFGLTNDQLVATTDLDVAVYGSFGIESDTVTAADADDAPEREIRDSSFAVDDNVLKATAAGNISTNTLSESSTNSESSAGLLSEQLVGGSEESTSALADSELFARITSTDSTISISGNKTQALAVGNEGVNTVSVSGTNLDSNDTVADIGNINAAGLSGINLEADKILTAGQYTYGTTIDAVADATIYNLDNREASTTGLVNGSVSFSENTVSSTALANNNTNTMTLAADATNQQSGAVVNQQSSSAGVSARTTAAITVDLYGRDQVVEELVVQDLGSALNGSSVDVASNIVSATAHGNVASNALNASGTVLDYSDGSAAAAGVGSEMGAATGQFALGSYQSNSGNISANAADTVIGVALNGGTSDFAALNASSISVVGNIVQATATANSAYNSVTLTGYDVAFDNENYESVALSNQQYTTGNVYASVSNTTIGTSSVGAVNGSTAGVVGNTMSASATGNRASSVITRR